MHTATRGFFLYMTQIEIQLPKNQEDLQTEEDILRLGNQLILSNPNIFLEGVCSVETTDASINGDMWILRLAMSSDEQSTIGFTHDEILRFIAKKFGWSVFDVIFSTT